MATNLKTLAENNPQIKFNVELKQNRHPILIAEYSIIINKKSRKR